MFISAYKPPIVEKKKEELKVDEDTQNQLDELEKKHLQNDADY